MRSVSRVVGVSINTVTKLLVDAGTVAERFHHQRVRNVEAERVQCDEIWAFCYAKQKNVPAAQAAPEGAGDVWTWTAIDSDTKLLITWLVTPGRNHDYAVRFLDDLHYRITDRVQLSTDGMVAYLPAVETVFGADVDYGQIIKTYGTDPTVPPGRYSPARCTGARKWEVTGHPHQGHISTSHVERANLTMRMSMRRFTRLTNAFSKKIENHRHSLALFYYWYNFCRIHKTLGTTPAVRARITNRQYELERILRLIDSN